MKKPVKIDLRNLTKRKLSMAKPNAGGLCEYAAPCIIGTLVPPRERERLDDGVDGDSSIDHLVCVGEVEIPKDQEEDARRLQRAFDCGDWERVERLAKPYLDKTVPA